MLRARRLHAKHLHDSGWSAEALATYFEALATYFNVSGPHDPTSAQGGGRNAVIEDEAKLIRRILERWGLDRARSPRRSPCRAWLAVATSHPSA